MPPRNTLRQPLPSTGTPDEVLRSLKDVLKAIEGICVLSTKDSSSIWALRIEAEENTWSRNARRKKRQRVIAHAQHFQMINNKHRSLTLVCGVRVDCLAPGKEKETNSRKIDQDWMDVDDPWFAGEVHMQEEKQTDDLALEFQWVIGVDRGLFESLVAHVGRKVFEHLIKH